MKSKKDKQDLEGKFLPVLKAVLKPIIAKDKSADKKSKEVIPKKKS